MSKVKFVYSGPAHAAELVTPVQIDDAADKAERQNILSGWLQPGAHVEIDDDQLSHPTLVVWIARGWMTRAPQTPEASAATPETPAVTNETPAEIEASAQSVTSRRRG